MKRLKIMTLSALAMAALCGCEMKEELWNSDKPENGELRLGLELKLPASQNNARAVGDVATADYPVTIKGTVTSATGGTTDVVREYAKASEVPASITLPVGSYTVTAHTPGEISKQMDNPYYGGNTEMKITKGVTTESTVTCKMQNSRIQMQYGTDFRNNFATWNISVDDGSSSAITYSTSAEDPAAKYWYFGSDEVTIITVNIRATTKTGNTITESRQFKKADAAEKYDDVSDFYEGGDAIVINMGAVENNTGTVTGISITTAITFENYTEQVEIPTYVQEETLSISEPEGNNYLTTGVDVTETAVPANVALNVVATAGLQNVFLKAESTHADATNYFAMLGLTTGDGKDLAASSSSNLGTIFPLPSAGANSYTFSLSVSLLTQLRNYTGTHRMTLKVTDAKGNTETRTLTVRVAGSGGESGGDDEADKPSMVYVDADNNDLFEQGIRFTTGGPYPTAQNIDITAPKGIKSMKVTITSGNEGFAATVDDLGFVDRELVGDTVLADLFTGLGLAISLPEANATSYVFPIGTFYNLMDIYGPTDSGKSHVFTIRLEDNAGNVIDKALNVTISEQ